MITLDTSGILALLDAADGNHDGAVAVFTDDPGPVLVPAGLLSEVAYMVETRLTHPALDALVADLEDGVFLLDCGEQDFRRIRELLDRYESLPLGFADAAAIACAERNGGRVLTFDRRDFGVVAREGAITLFP